MSDSICIFCNQEFQSIPIILPCSYTVCDFHVKCDDLVKCLFCDQNHKTSENNKYPVNRVEEIKLKNKSIKKDLREMEQTLKDFQTIQDDPNVHVYNYFEKLRGKIHERKDEIVESITQHFESMLEKIDSILKKYKEKNQSCFRQNSLNLNEIEENLKKYEAEINNSNLNLIKLGIKIKEAKCFMQKIDEDMQTFKDDLIQKSEMYKLTYKKIDLDYEELFGRIYVEVIIF